MADRRTPFPNSDERTTLVAFLDYLRESVVRKTEGLDDEAVRRVLVPSGTTLLGLVKHLTMVEVSWFQWSFAGLDVAIPALELEDGDTIESVVADYRTACTASNTIVERWDDLDRRAARAATAPEPMSMRWLLVHMIEETARHAGHADILREQIDGSVGR
jgi:uncharacterized damage-inducible protein DinB